MTVGRDGFIPPYMDLATLAEHLCVSAASIDSWVSQGLFPAPVRIATKRLWNWKEVEYHLARKPIGSDTNSAADPQAERVREGTRRVLEQSRRKPKPKDTTTCQKADPYVEAQEGQGSTPAARGASSPKIHLLR